ncbi:MAG: hypothetical protein F4Y75_06580 [Acidimicrobiia bacterium]|nr:hypothetical protein [Acidimicrobiia bacterium]
MAKAVFRGRERDLRQAAVRDESGSAVIVTLMSMGVALLTVVFLMNGLLMLYTRSVIRYAADSGAQAGALSGGTVTTCADTATAIIEELAHYHRKSTQVTCTRGPDTTTASIGVRLAPLFPALGPSWSFTTRATSVTEPVP